MMKRYIYIVLTVVLLSVGGWAKAGRYDNSGDFEKVLLKDEMLNFSELKQLKIDNVRGDITLKTWDKPFVSVSVTFVADIRNENKLKRILKNIELFYDGWEFSTKAKAKLQLNNETYGFNFTVYAPENVRADLKTRFGNVWLESLHTDSKIDCEFVSMQVGEVVGDEKPLDLKLKFASDVEIENVPNLELTASFSSISIENVERIKTKTSFSKLEVAGKTIKADLDSQHDKIEWEVLERLYAKDLDFCKISIEKLLKEMKVENIDFGKIDIEEVLQDFEEIDINAEFTPVNIEFGKNVCYEFKIDQNFGKLSIPKDLEIFINKKGNNSQQLEGKKKGRGKVGVLRISNNQGRTTIK